MKKGEPGAGSLDMLLDTMCNTFGGVCFIALLVAIISASLPKEVSETSAGDSRQLLANEQLALLQRECDELKQAISLKEDLLAESMKAGTNVVTPRNLTLESQEVGRLKRTLRQQCAELESDIAKNSTDSEYNRNEAKRLEKLEKTLREDLRKLKTKRSKVVRMPLERDVPGCSPVDFWIREGQLYVLLDYTQCHCAHGWGDDDFEWKYTIIEGMGNRITPAFLKGPEAKKILKMLAIGTFARIYSDTDSFHELSLFIDFCVKNKKPYNWYPENSTELKFVRGVDSKVQ